MKLENMKLNTTLWLGIAFSALFTLLIWLADPLLNRFVTAAGEGSMIFYEWQLAEHTVMGRITAWGMYAVHQLTLWGLIYYAQNSVKKYSTGLHPVNLWALGVNALHGFTLCPNSPLVRRPRHGHEFLHIARLGF